MMFRAASNRRADNSRCALAVREPDMLACLLLALLLALKVAVLDGQAAEASATSGSHGPTIRLDYAAGRSNGSPVASFMYFVPLISPEPVASITSPGSTQSVQLFSEIGRASC